MSRDGEQHHALLGDHKPPTQRGGDEETEKQSIFHPSSGLYRFVVLILICNTTFGSYYCYDIPGALKGQLFMHFPEMTQLQYNLLYSLYSWPNTVQVFFGGYIIDRYLGVRRGCAICCVVLCFGQALVCFGVQQRRVDLVLAGRFLFGVGGETLAVGQSAYAAQWFKGAELATAFGVVLSFSRIGSAVNFDVSPAVVEYVNESQPGSGLIWAMYVGNIFCVFSLLCCLLLNWMDHRAEKMRLDTDSVASVVSDEEVSSVCAHARAHVHVCLHEYVNVYTTPTQTHALDQANFEQKWYNKVVPYINTDIHVCIAIHTHT